MGQEAFRFRTIDKNGQHRGGARPGAGRPCIKHRRASERHEEREVFKPSEPVHVVTRILPGVGSLRRRGMYQAIREATITAAKRENARIVHMSIQRTHLHLIVETTGRQALSRAMQGFLVSAARLINRVSGRSGTVFADRYHTTVLRSPRQVRNCIEYVLNNWRKHREDRGRTWTIDPFSSAISFAGWKELVDKLFMFRRPRTYDPLIVWLPRTWLLSAGWRKHGLVGAFDVPGGAPRNRAGGAGANALRG